MALSCGKSGSIWDKSARICFAFQPMDFGEYADNFFCLAEELEQLFQRKVDLITENSLANPFFIKAVNQTKVKIYG